MPETRESDVLPEMLSPIVLADPPAFYRRLRDENPVHRDDSVGAYLISRHRDVGAAYRDPNFTSENYEWQIGPAFGRTILGMSGKEHLSKRAVVNPRLRGDPLRHWEPSITQLIADVLDGVVQNTADELVAPLRHGMTVDLVKEFANRLPLQVIAELLAIPRDDRPFMFHCYYEMGQVLDNLERDEAVYEAGRKARREFAAYLAPVIDERRANPGEDLISAISTARVDGQHLEFDEVVSYIAILLNAGAETTDRTIGYALRLLLEHPDQLEAVRADESLMTNVASETLRWASPSQMNGRILGDDVEVAGVTIPKDSYALLLIASANRDESRFERPDEFNIFRSDLDHSRSFTAGADHFAFGGGKHFCVGAMLAKLEIETALKTILQRFPNLRLADGFRPGDSGFKMRSTSRLDVVLG